MKRNNYIAMLSWIASGFLFAIGMSEVLAPEFGTFNSGIALGLSGIILALVTWIVWRRASGKEGIRLSLKKVCEILLGIIGTLTFGAGMCFSMIWNRISIGIVISLAGIALLLSLIPIVKGIEGE